MDMYESELKTQETRNSDSTNEVSNSKHIPIPDITILRLNYWLEDSYDQIVLQAFGSSGERISEETKSEGGNK